MGRDKVSFIAAFPTVAQEQNFTRAGKSSGHSV